MNVALLLRYDGSAYHGWQIQKNAVSVCATVTRAIEKTVGHSVTLHGCGRTDAGVHARRYVANFRSDTRIPPDRLPYALNSRLPEDVAVMDAAVVPDEFHAIGSCIKKQYTYYIYPARHRDPFSTRRALQYHYPLDVEMCRAAAAQFVGTHDFACVKSAGTDVKSTVRTLYSFDVKPDGDMVAFELTANGFLYNMARSLVGSVLYANEGKLDDIPALLRSGDRTAAGPTLPPHGLYMTGVWYGDILEW